jgi:hypothetical protein
LAGANDPGDRTGLQHPNGRKVLLAHCGIVTVQTEEDMSVICRSALIGTLLFGGLLLSNFAAVAQNTSSSGERPTINYECAPPFKNWGTREPILQPPVVQDKVRPGGSATLCYFHDTEVPVTLNRCFRTELIFDKYPEWQCPLDDDCFAGGRFENAYLEEVGDGRAKTCVVFHSKIKRFSQDVVVEFRLQKNAD